MNEVYKRCISIGKMSPISWEIDYNAYERQEEVYNTTNEAASNYSDNITAATITAKEEATSATSVAVQSHTYPRHRWKSPLSPTATTTTTKATQLEYRSTGNIESAETMSTTTTTMTTTSEPQCCQPRGDSSLNPHCDAIQPLHQQHHHKQHHHQNHHNHHHHRNLHQHQTAQYSSPRHCNQLQHHRDQPTQYCQTPSAAPVSSPATVGLQSGGLPSSPSNHQSQLYNCPRDAAFAGTACCRCFCSRQQPQLLNQQPQTKTLMTMTTAWATLLWSLAAGGGWGVAATGWASAVGDAWRCLRSVLPLLLLLNMLPMICAVASADRDAAAARGPNAAPWFPIVAHLEPPPRPTKAPKCDQTFVSRPGGLQNGTFSAPMLDNPLNISRQCLYIFLAGPGQRVEVLFTAFNLRGSPQDGAAVGEIPACSTEYMDIYAEVQSSDPADLINSPFGGRYCGPTPPRRRISLHRAVALSFYSSKMETKPSLFTGRYQFVNASTFEIGTPVTGSTCSFTITSHKNKSDVFISPTYPGAYPKDMSCTYQFIGEPSQRVRLEFRDFDLFFGGPHCPFDYVKVYDGVDNSSALIGTYCGQQRNLVLYSSESSLMVHFFTLQRTAHTQNRGFKGIYEFSESFVKLDFIRQNSGFHIRGSECDQKILSRKESSGMVYSPNYPYPYLPKTVCRYFVYGMQDAQHLERVRLMFEMFEMHKGEQKDKDKESNCTDGYLKIYLKGQETQDAYDKFDYELCGIDTPHMVVSDGPRLAMVFSSGELQARGFKARYTFETEYKIPGTAAPDGACEFTYRSTSRKRGDFNSPRYPSNYPSATNCTYLFVPTPNEQVTIVFDHFKVKAEAANATSGAYGSAFCFEDWLEMFVIFRDGPDRFLGRYCGLTAPGPVESPVGATGLRVLLHTNPDAVASGFKARYIFETAKSVFGDCGGNFTNDDSGVIVSPNYPAKYDGPGKGRASAACNWYLAVRPSYKIALSVEVFSVEGDPNGRGCPAAVLRVWQSPESDTMAPVELCGEKPFGDTTWHYLSTGQTMRISFTTTDKTIGAGGFRIVWTAVQEVPTDQSPATIGHHCETSYLFQCELSGYCIAERLRCDKTKNCGPGDDSDEMHCIVEVIVEDHSALIITSLAATSFLICLLFTVCHCRRKRRTNHRQLGLHRNGHYDSTTSATVLNSFSGLSSSRRHLQSGNSLSGSLRGINSDLLAIPPAPLPPTGVPPHICVVGGVGGEMNGDLMDDEDDEDDLMTHHQQQHQHQHQHQHGHQYQHGHPGSSFMNGGGGGVGGVGGGGIGGAVDDRFSSGDSV